MKTTTQTVETRADLKKILGDQDWNDGMMEDWKEGQVLERRML
jgi:hypothetical protein